MASSQELVQHALLPLPLTPFEEYMFVDDRPEHPMTYAVRFRFEGRVDRAKLDQAASDALRQQPLLTAVVDDSQATGPRWLPADELPAVDWIEPPETIADRGSYSLDLRREPGVRLWAQTEGDGFELIAMFHHTSTDGVGVMRFVGDILARYGRLCGDRIEAFEIDAQRLRSRGDSRWVKRDVPVSRWTAIRGLLREAYKLFTQKPVPLAGPSADLPGRPFPGLNHQTLPAEVYAGLRSAAVENGATLNDMLIRDLLMHIRDWNRRHGDARQRDWLGINMPTNLRNKDDERMPSANVMSYAFLTHSVAACDRPGELLEHIHFATQHIKRWNLGMYFLDGLERARRWPGVLRFFAQRPTCFATATLSNLGDPTRRFYQRLPRVDGRVKVGDLLLKRVIASPPLRAKTRCGLVVFTDGGELTLTARCDPYCFSESDAEDFLEQYVSRLTDSAALRG